MLLQKSLIFFISPAFELEGTLIQTVFPIIAILWKRHARGFFPKDFNLDLFKSKANLYLSYSFS